MADTGETSDKKPSPVPLIIGGVVVVAIIGFFVLRKKPKRQAVKAAAPRPKADPCEGIPEWACATAALLDPLAKTSVDVYKASAQADIERARLRA